MKSKRLMYGSQGFIVTLPSKSSLRTTPVNNSWFVCILDFFISTMKPPVVYWIHTC